MRLFPFSALASVAVAVGALMPSSAQADPWAWSCGQLWSTWCFNCTVDDNMDNSNSCATHTGNDEDDLILRMRLGVKTWVQVAGDPGGDSKLGAYATRGSVCTSPVAQSSSSPGWGSPFNIGFPMDANTYYYIAIEELDYRWAWTPNYSFDLTRMACCPDNDGDGTYAYNSACNSMPAHLRDCNDSDGTNAPGRPEVCDGRDNNCNNVADEGLTFLRYYRDADGDGYGNPSSHVDRCTAPTGYVRNNTDCDDSTGQRRPGLSEICDGLDNNCNGPVDEGVTSTFYRDFDGDNYGDTSNPTQACSRPNGYRSAGGDCDDHDADRRPGLAEWCDNKDNNCNGPIDEGVGQAWYRDFDGDGAGNAGNSILSCFGQSGYVASSDDCADNDSQRRPGLSEWCDGKDNDCNFVVDDGVGDLWFTDAAHDGHGNPATQVQACNNPGGRVSLSDDCDDTDALRHPGLDEVCNS